MNPMDQHVTFTQMLVDKTYCLMNETSANRNGSVKEIESADLLNYQLEANNETSNLINFEFEKEMSSCKDIYNETLHGGQFVNEDMLLENLIQHCDQVNQKLDLVTPRPVIPCEENENTPINSTCRASRLIDVVSRLKDNSNYSTKKPKMIKHQQGVSRSKRNSYDKQVLLEETTLKTWKAKYVSLLRSTDLVGDKSYFNESVWRSNVWNNPLCRVNKCIESYWKKSETNKFFVPNPNEGTALKSKEPNDYETQSFKFSEIEKLRAIGDDNTTTNSFRNNDQAGTCGSTWRMASLDFTGWKHRGVAVDKRFSLASGYASDSQAETGGFSSVNTPNLDNNLQTDNFFTRRLGGSLSMDHTFPNISFNDWMLKNQMFETGGKCSDESIENDRSRMSEEPYSLSHTFSKSASPSFMDRTFLPISLETIQNEPQDCHGFKNRFTTNGFYTWTRKKFHESLLECLSRISSNKEINFNQLVPPDEANAFHASTTFFNLLMLASSNEISIKQKSFDSPLLVTLVLDVVNTERCTKNDTADISFYSQNDLILTPC
ncbi:uncharacterized protein LOC128883765 [Hylaeus volcanicus]|uniref:uncharacterized protein LOC128883765 n=1 Tax=Hylaeus volcanicus TaxID=313075 RepID=UPI0023B7EC6C|nr:uncharacterized protein LOC128883765 [Hylaeus volcanicus]